MVLATKLLTDALAEFRKRCLPKNVTDYSYDEAVVRLRLLFSKQRSVFADHYDCKRLNRDEGEEFMHVVNRCKAALKTFKFEELTKEQFDALILLSALKWPADEPLRARILRSLTKMVMKSISTLLPTSWTSSLQRRAAEFSPTTSISTQYRSHRRNVVNAANIHLKSASCPN